MHVYYDRDADLNLIKGKKVAIIGYGSQIKKLFGVLALIAFLGAPSAAHAKPCKHITPAIQTCSQAKVACEGRCRIAACPPECQKSWDICMRTGRWSTPLCSETRLFRRE